MLNSQNYCFQTGGLYVEVDTTGASTERKTKKVRPPIDGIFFFDAVQPEFGWFITPRKQPGTPNSLELPSQFLEVVMADLEALGQMELVTKFDSAPKIAVSYHSYVDSTGARRSRRHRGPKDVYRTHRMSNRQIRAAGGITAVTSANII